MRQGQQPNTIPLKDLVLLFISITYLAAIQSFMLPLAPYIDGADSVVGFLILIGGYYSVRCLSTPIWIKISTSTERQVLLLASIALSGIFTFITAFTSKIYFVAVLRLLSGLFTIPGIIVNELVKQYCALEFTRIHEIHNIAIISHIFGYFFGILTSIITAFAPLDSGLSDELDILIPCAILGGFGIPLAVVVNFKMDPPFHIQIIEARKSVINFREELAANTKSDNQTASQRPEESENNKFEFPGEENKLQYEENHFNFMQYVDCNFMTPLDQSLEEEQFSLSVIPEMDEYDQSPEIIQNCSIFEDEDEDEDAAPQPQPQEQSSIVINVSVIDKVAVSVMEDDIGPTIESPRDSPRALKKKDPIIPGSIDDDEVMRSTPLNFAFLFFIGNQTVCDYIDCFMIIWCFMELDVGFVSLGMYLCCIYFIPEMLNLGLFRYMIRFLQMPQAAKLTSIYCILSLVAIPIISSNIPLNITILCTLACLIRCGFVASCTIAMLYIDDSVDKNNSDSIHQKGYMIGIACRTVGLILAVVAYEVGVLGLYWLECGVVVMVIILGYLIKS